MQRWICTALTVCWAVWTMMAGRSHGCVLPPRRRSCGRRSKHLNTSGAPLHLTMEAGALTRWASGIVRPLVERLIICEPRHNRLIHSNPTKGDEADVEGMWLLLRVGKLKEVWVGADRAREIYRALVYELLNWRDAQRELKSLIKARYRQWGRAPTGWTKGIFQTIAPGISRATCLGKRSGECSCASTLSTITRLRSGR